MFPAYASRAGQIRGGTRDKIMRWLRKELTVSVQIKCLTLLLPNEHFCFFNLIQHIVIIQSHEGEVKKVLFVANKK